MVKAAPKYQARELTVADAVSEAFSELQQLGEEMRDAFDNTPESLQGSGVGEARGEAADALENLSEPDAPDELAAIMVNWSVRVRTPSQQRKLSRADRRDDATSTLSAVISKLEDIRDYEPETDDEGKVTGEREFSEEQVDAAGDFIDEVQNLIDEAEAVTFPGMYG